MQNEWRHLEEDFRTILPLYIIQNQGDLDDRTNLIVNPVQHIELLMETREMLDGR